MRLAWLTDLHLNFVTPGHVDRLCRAVREAGADAVLLGGDIAEAPDVEEQLEGLGPERAAGLLRPGQPRLLPGEHRPRPRRGRGLCARVPRLHWPPASGVIELTTETTLVGHDGWADGRFGDYERSEVFLNDYLLIEELAGLDENERLLRLNALGDEAAAHFRAVLPGALARSRRVIVLTHVPPFREACWHRGRVSDDAWLPHFACKAVGEVLVEAMASHPECEMTVLCGHTHSAGEAQVLPNLRAPDRRRRVRQAGDAADADRRLSRGAAIGPAVLRECNNPPGVFRRGAWADPARRSCHQDEFDGVHVGDAGAGHVRRPGGLTERCGPSNGPNVPTGLRSIPCRPPGHRGNTRMKPGRGARPRRAPSPGCRPVAGLV